MQDVPAEGNTNCASDHKKDFKLITGLRPVQKVKVIDSCGTLVEMLAMIDSGSNTSQLSKNAAERLGIAGTATHLTMNLAGGEKRSETSDHCCLEYGKGYQKDPGSIHHKETVEHFPHLKPVANKLHLSGGTIDILIGTDFLDTFVDIHTLSGNQESRLPNVTALVGIF